MNVRSDLLNVGCEAEAARIGSMLLETVLRQFRKKGVVVAMSGGIDSSVVAALSVRALGPERVFGLLMPEQVERVFRDIDSKRRFARYLHSPPVLVDELH